MSIWIFRFVETLHLVWAVIILWTGHVPQSTPLASLGRFGPYWSATALILASALAITATEVLCSRLTWQCSTIVIPQQVLLVMSAVSSLDAVLSGHYADGVMRPASFILTDQLYAILTAVVHGIAVFNFMTSAALGVWLVPARRAQWQRR